MSAALAIRSYGRPYFGMSQTDLTGMSGSTLFSGFGVAEMYLEFRLDGFPVRAATADEFHPLWSFHDAIFHTELLAIGVTPSGRVAGIVPGGSLIQTQVGRIQPGDGWHAVRLNYDGGASQATLVLDADNTIVSAIGVGYATAVLCALSLFNGGGATTKCACSIRLATVAGTDGVNPGLATYSLRERDESSIAPTLSGGGSPDGWTLAGASAETLTLTAGWIDPAPVARIWGAMPEDDPSSAFQWDIGTTYTRREIPQTVYHRVAT